MRCLRVRRRAPPLESTIIGVALGTNHGVDGCNDDLTFLGRVFETRLFERDRIIFPPQALRAHAVRRAREVVGEKILLVSRNLAKLVVLFESRLGGTLTRLGCFGRIVEPEGEVVVPVLEPVAFLVGRADALLLGGVVLAALVTRGTSAPRLLPVPGTHSPFFVPTAAKMRIHHPYRGADLFAVVTLARGTGARGIR